MFYKPGSDAGAPRVVVAAVPDRGPMWYLVDQDLDFIPEVKDFLDWKTATRRAPATVAAYCQRLRWYYVFLHQRRLSVLEATPTVLTDFVIWLSSPAHGRVGHQPLQASSINLILQAVAALYQFLVRRGSLAVSPLQRVEVPRGRWLTEHDLLAHTRWGRQAQVVQRLELKLKVPRRLPKMVSSQDFHAFVNSIHQGQRANEDPTGFRDRAICLLLKEGGFRIGELLGWHLEDLAFGQGGVHVRFRPDNANHARAKAGYGRDRFVHLPTELLGLLDIYLTEVWIEAQPRTDHVWLVLKRDAKDRQGCPTFGTALDADAVGMMFRHYSAKSGVRLHPHMLRHTHATELVRSYLTVGQAVDWKFIQERLGHYPDALIDAVRGDPELRKTLLRALLEGAA